MTQYSKIASEEFGTSDLTSLAPWQMDRVTSKAMNWSPNQGRTKGRAGGVNRGSSWYSN